MAVINTAAEEYPPYMDVLKQRFISPEYIFPNLALHHFSNSITSSRRLRKEIAFLNSFSKSCLSKLILARIALLYFSIFMFK